MPHAHLCPPGDALEAGPIIKIETDLKNNALHPRDAKMMWPKKSPARFMVMMPPLKPKRLCAPVPGARYPGRNAGISFAARQTVVDVLTTAGLAASNSEARRLVQQGGVRLDGEQLDQRRRFSRIAVCCAWVNGSLCA
jgi:tyrosyl-tRNA synthetase